MSKQQQEIADDLLYRWRSGLLYKPAGYLLDIVRSLPKDDWNISFEEFCQRWEISERTFYRGKADLAQLGLLPKEWKRMNLINTEQRVRDRLHQELGGQVEVTIAVGRIDLLTDTEIVEVKEFRDWKSALGQILAYGAFFPSHQKRIHLFGTAKQIAKLVDIEAACISFDVLVTGEVMGDE